MEHIKLIWDFRGPAAQKTAEHHQIHLKDYIKIEKTQLQLTGVETLSEMHVVAFMIVTKEEMKMIRDALKPHRGQVYHM